MPKCDVCNISLGANDMRAHVTGRRHLKKVELLEKLNPQDAPLKTGKTPPAGALQNIVVPALNNIPTAVPVQILKPPAVPAQILKPPAVPAQILKPPAVPVQILKPPAVPVQILKPPAVPVQILKPPTVPVQNNKPLTPAQNDKPSAPVENDKPSTPAQNNKPEMPAANSNAKAKPEKKIPARDKRKRDEKRKGLDPKTSVPPAFVDMNLPFEQQVDHFISQIRQTENEAINIQRVLYDIAQTFAPVMPGVIPILYGSQMTGLAFRTSDIDVYLCNPYRIEDREFIRQHGRAIYWCQRFTNIALITNARVPVIKARHAPTGIELDISNTSGHAVANSALLRFLLSYDPRLWRLFMLIGYWAKKVNLISTNKFSRYSFNLLVLYYLQNLPDPILPPISKLVYVIPGNLWPTKVDHNVMKLQHRNGLPLHELFMGFFEFYNDFPFAEFVVSTYMGKKIPAADIDKPYILDWMPPYKWHVMNGGERLAKRVVCVQDPIELNHNTSKQVTQKGLEQLELSIKKAIEMKSKFNVKQWLNEILTGETGIPIEEKPKAQEYSFFFTYKAGPDWCEDLQKSLTSVFSLFSINVGPLRTNIDTKKFKLNLDCIGFSIQTNSYPFSASNKKILELLKSKTVDLNLFKKNFDPKPNDPNSSKYLFVASCIVTQRENNSFKLVFTNEGDPVSFYKTIFNFKGLDLLLEAVNSEKNDKDKTEPTSEVASTADAVEPTSDVASTADAEVKT